MAGTMLWRAKCDLFNQTILLKSGHENEVQNEMVEGKIESRVGFEMYRDESRVSFGGHVIAVFPNTNTNTTPNKLGLVRDSVH